MSGELPSRWERWPLPWIGAAVGVAIGLFDTLLGYSMGIEMRVGESDVALPVMAFFCATYAGLGYVVGSLIRAQSRARRAEGVIAAQLRELEAKQQELIQNEKLAAIGRLAAGIAHEVRNPLGVIRASAAMVQESFEAGDDPHRACEFICEEIDRLNGLITALLSFARPTQPRRESVSLDEVVERALELAGNTLKSRGVHAEHRCETAALDISADPDLVSQLVYGLLSNAVEALEPTPVSRAAGTGRANSATSSNGEPPRIEIRTGIRGASAYVEVADSGPGVEETSAAQIFEPFFTTKDTGTGLGLPMALRIAEAHGGSLRSLTGKGAGARGTGACFHVDLPIEAEAAAGLAVRMQGASGP